jgi:hypothetical protein
MPGTIGDYIAWTHSESISETLTPAPGETQMSFSRLITIPSMALTGTAPGLFAMATWKARRVPEGATTPPWNIENAFIAMSPNINVEVPNRGTTSTGTFGQAANPNVNNIRSHSINYKRSPDWVSGGVLALGGFFYMGDQLTFGAPVYPAEFRGIVIACLLHDLDGLTPQPNTSLPFPESSNYTPRLSWSHPTNLISPVFTSGPVPITSFAVYDPGPAVPHIICYLADNGDGGGLPPLSTLEDADDGWGDIVAYRDYDFSIMLGLAMPGRTLPHPSGITPGSSMTTQGGRGITNNIPVAAARGGRVMVVG